MLLTLFPSFDNPPYGGGNRFSQWKRDTIADDFMFALQCEGRFVKKIFRQALQPDRFF
jgi:hypothetical protein